MWEISQVLYSVPWSAVFSWLSALWVICCAAICLWQMIGIRKLTKRLRPTVKELLALKADAEPRMKADNGVRRRASDMLYEFE
jgi:hypothetical protein